MPVSKLLPPVLLLLDANVLLTTDVRDWQQFPVVGNALLPQAVADEMQFLLTRAPDPDLERVAREFQRFQTTHRWQSLQVVASHPLLKGPAGQAMSKKARLSLAVAKCAYGLAKQYPSRLVVLATNDQPQVQRLQMLQLPNLCGITGTTLRHWSQSGQRPIPVMQRWQQMKESGLNNPSTANLQNPKLSNIPQEINLDLQSSLSSLRSQPAVRSASGIPTAIPKPTRSPKSGHLVPNQRLSDRPNPLAQLVSLVAASIVLIVVIWLGWQLFQPENLKQFWQDSPTSEAQ